MNSSAGTRNTLKRVEKRLFNLLPAGFLFQTPDSSSGIGGNCFKLRIAESSLPEERDMSSVTTEMINFDSKNHTTPGFFGTTGRKETAVYFTPTMAANLGNLFSNMGKQYARTISSA